MSQIFLAPIRLGPGILPAATNSVNLLALIPIYIAASKRLKPRRGIGRMANRAVERDTVKTPCRPKMLPSLATAAKISESNVRFSVMRILYRTQKFDPLTNSKYSWWTILQHREERSRRASIKPGAPIVGYASRQPGR
jgi:hypothetical protein